MTDEPTTKRRHRHTAMRQGPLLPLGHNKPGPPARFPKYPVRARLSATQSDVFNLIALEPRTVTALSLALNIESPTAAWAVATLERRGLVEVVASYPTHFGIVNQKGTRKDSG